MDYLILYKTIEQDRLIEAQKQRTLNIARAARQLKRRTARLLRAN